MSHFSSKFHLWVKMLRSANPWMNVPKWNKLPTDFPCSESREQWTLCREHVNRNTVHARSSLLMSWLSESGVFIKRDMQNMQNRGGMRTGIGKRWATSWVIHRWENFIAQLVKVLQYQEGRSGCWCLSAILALSAQREWTRWWRIMSARTGCTVVCKYIRWQTGRKDN